MQPPTPLVEVYSKDYCPYCVKAKMLLDRLNVPYTLIDLSQEPARIDELRARAPHARTVPQIFINGKNIGGCDDLHALHDNGKLQALLA